jgi:hypothetical protein
MRDLERERELLLLLLFLQLLDTILPQFWPPGTVWAGQKPVRKVQPK